MLPVLIAATLGGGWPAAAQTPDAEVCDFPLAAIPDPGNVLDPTSASFSLEVSDDFETGDVQLEVSWREGRPALLTLTSPAGTSIVVRRGSRFDRPEAYVRGGAIDCTYSDYGLPWYDVETICRCLVDPPDLYTPVYGGEPQPTIRLGTLADFAGESCQGTWTLQVSKTANDHAPDTFD